MSEEKLDLANEPCITEGIELAMGLAEAMKLLPLLDPAWSINQAGHLERVYLLKNFKESIQLAKLLGEIAEEAQHFPDLWLSYGKLRAELWTHKISGLSRADFVLAAKFDQKIALKDSYV